MMRRAVLDDVTPAEKGTVLEYWQGETDLDPVGHRRDVFHAVWELYERGFVQLVQARLPDGRYSYRGVVR